jgi:hypothetical protein
MRQSITAFLAVIRSALRTRAELEAEILALRHQLAVLQQATPRRLRLSRTDRLLWVVLSRVWSRWRDAVQIVQPATVVQASASIRVALALAIRAAPPRSSADRRRRPRTDSMEGSTRRLRARPYKSHGNGCRTPDPELGQCGSETSLAALAATSSCAKTPPTSDHPKLPGSRGGRLLHH